MNIIIKCPHCHMNIELTSILVYPIPKNSWVSRRCSRCHMNIEYLLDEEKEK
jgi:hypothetical protein